MADTATTHKADQTLESKLEEMLDIETFDPPEEFVKQALLDDPSVYEEAEKDWKGWWMKQAKELHWFKEPLECVSSPLFEVKTGACDKVLHSARYQGLARACERGDA